MNFLIELYENKPITSGLNYFELDYSGKKLKLYYKSSKLHLIIFDLINLINQFESVIGENKTVFICGNANINDNMLGLLSKLKDDFNKNGTLKVDRISKDVLTDLIKNECVIKSGEIYMITQKGLIIDIAE